MKRNITRMTEIEKAVLKAIRDFWEFHKYSPAFGDLELATGYGFSSIQHALEKLQRFEAITRDRGISRSIVITDEGHAWFSQEAA